MKILQSMSVSDLKKLTATDWVKVKALTDEEIDTSDVPPLGDGFFANAKFRFEVMRLRLLADRMVDQKEFDIAEAKVVVVPDGNTAYREKITSPPLAKRFHKQKTVAGVVRATLKHPDDAFSRICTSTLADAVRQGCGGTVSEWVAYQHERYWFVTWLGSPALDQQE